MPYKNINFVITSQSRIIKIIHKRYAVPSEMIHFHINQKNMGTLVGNLQIEVQKIMKKIFDCIICPMSCHLEVEKNNEGIIFVSRNSCTRRAAFGKQELIKPMRILTTTV